MACTFSTSQLPKVVRDRQFLTLLTSKCASRHNGVHFFDISTSKSGPELVCFVHFDLEMCFAPQRRALFRRLNFQKWSGAGVFCTFWLQIVLRATTGCTFLTSQLPKVVRRWGALYILTWKCASRHNGVQFFISHLASWLRTRRFSEPTFRPTGATNHWKNTVFRDFPTFSRICIFFLLILSLLTLLTSAFQLSILSEVSLLNFLRWIIYLLIIYLLIIYLLIIYLLIIYLLIIYLSTYHYPSMYSFYHLFITFLYLGGAAGGGGATWHKICGENMGKQCFHSWGQKYSRDGKSTKHESDMLLLTSSYVLCL